MNDTKDSVTFEQAQNVFDAGNYEESIRMYELLTEQEYVEEVRVNGIVIDDLSNWYNIDDLAIEEDIQQVELLRYSAYLLGILLFFCFLLWIVLRWSRRRTEHYNKQLNLAIEKERESMQGKSLLLANMSHEIRTPLNALSGFSDLLASEDIDREMQVQCNEIIQLNSELLLKLINDVVDISALNIGQMTFSLSRCNALQICEKVVKTVNRVKTTQVPILLELGVDDLELTTDVTRFQQVLINLLMNANKFTTSGKIVLRVEKESENIAQFSVTDTGCGIPESRSQTIFSRFEKLDEKTQGTGLGLSICQVIVRRMGGDIWLDTSYKEGARFVATHPIN
ncbi:MAG: sensor histidine kinase [Phocaeicola sp.]